VTVRVVAVVTSQRQDASREIAVTIVNPEPQKTRRKAQRNSSGSEQVKGNMNVRVELRRVEVRCEHLWNAATYEETGCPQ